MPEREPAVSAVMTVYNGARHLGASLECVLAQTWTDFELIVVDDGSWDESVEVVRRYADPRVRLLQKENRGAASAVNVGVEAARGEFVAFIDQDDLWPADKLETHVEWMRKKPQLDLTFSWFAYVGEGGQGLGLRSTRYRGGIDFAGLLRDFVIGATSNVVVRRAAIERAGGVDAGVPRLYDLDLFLRVALAGAERLEAIPRELMFYRRHGTQITADFGTLREEWEFVLEKMRRLAPEQVAAAEGAARCSFNRYLARLAYESDRYGRALGYVADGFRASPGGFVADRRNWLTTAACVSGAVLPREVHRALERMAGLRRG